MSRLVSRLDPTAIRFDLLAPGTPLAAGTLPGGGTYTQAAGSGQTEETVQTSASTVARWAFVANLPRVGFLADGGIGLVLEPPRTNVLLRSDAVDNAQWIKNPVITINPNATASPTGTSDAETATGSDGNGYVSNQNTISAAVQTYCGTAWLKADVSRTLGIWVVDASDGAPGIARDWVIGTTWGRYGHTCDFDATTPSVGLFLGVNTRFAAGGTYGLWGAQAEKGRYPTNWIPTAAATASRAGFRVTVPLSRYVRGGAFRAVLTTVPHGAATEYDNDSATVRLWTIDAGTYAEFNTSTRVLTVSVNGVARVAGVPLWWLRGHRVQWSWEVGGGNLRVRYRYSTDQGATWTLPFDPFGGTVYSDSAISTASSTIDLYSDSGSSKWWGTGVVSEDAILTAPAWALQALPTDVASVKAFFRADSSYTLSAGTVSAWASLASTPALGLAQATGAFQPAFSGSGGPGGRPAISFDGINDSLVGNNRANYFSTTDGEIICGVRPDAASLGGAGAYFNFHGIVADNSGGLGLHYRTAGVLDAGNFAGSAQSAQGTYTLGQWTSLRWQHTGGNVSLGQDAGMGSLTSVASGATTSTGAICVGNGAVGYLTGLVTDVIICNAALSAAELAIIRSYLTARGLP